MFFEPSPFCDTLLFNFHLINLLDQLHKLVCKRILIGNTKIELRRSSCPEETTLTITVTSLMKVGKLKEKEADK